MSDFSFSGIEVGKFDKNYREELSNKEGLLKWLRVNGLDKLKAKGNLNLPNIKKKEDGKELSLYERAAWSRPDDNDMVKIRLEVRGKNVFLSEEHAKNNQHYMVNNDYATVKGMIENMVKQLDGADDNLNLYYRAKDENKKLVIKTL